MLACSTDYMPNTSKLMLAENKNATEMQAKRL